MRSRLRIGLILVMIVFASTQIVKGNQTKQCNSVEELAIYIQSHPRGQVWASQHCYQIWPILKKSPNYLKDSITEFEKLSKQKDMNQGRIETIEKNLLIVLRILRYHPVNESVGVFKDLIESEKVSGQVKYSAIRALGATMYGREYLKTLIQSENDYVRGGAFVALAWQYALQKEKENLKKLAVEARFIVFDKPLPNTEPSLPNPVSLTNDALNNIRGIINCQDMMEALSPEDFILQLFERKYGYKFSWLLFTSQADLLVARSGYIDESVFDEYFWRQIVTAFATRTDLLVELSRRHIQGSTWGFPLQLLLDFQIPLSKEEKELAEKAFGPIQDWPPLSMPGITGYEISEGQFKKVKLQ